MKKMHLLLTPSRIPKYWPRIIGIDFGSDHPFGAAELAWDRDADTVYVTKDYRESRAIPAIHAAAVKPRATGRLRGLMTG